MTKTSVKRRTVLPGQQAAPEGPVDLSNMYVMHHAFRRDLVAFRGAVAAAPLDHRDRWVALHRRWQLFATALHHHHSAEDAGLWPLVLGRVAAAGDERGAAVLDAMSAEHARIDPLLDECTGGFARLATKGEESVRAALRRSLDDTWAELDAHLGHEERDAMAILQEHLTDEDWRRVERERFRPAYSLREVLSVVPWAMAGLPREIRRGALAAGGGLPMSLLWWASRRSFARREAAAFGIAGASSSGAEDLRSPVVVVGATGTMGALVLHELVARRATVRVLVRVRRAPGYFPAGVQQVVADLGDEPALRAALDGARAALYVSPHEVDEERFARNFVHAAEAAGTRIVFAGVHLPSRTPTEWVQRKLTERMLPTYRTKLRIGQLVAASEGNPVIFSPTNFFQNDELFEADIRAGTFPMPMRRVNRVDVRDLAELCARALLEPFYPGGEHTIAGPVSLRGAECAQIWAEALNRQVTYVGDDADAWVPIYRSRVRGKKFTDLFNTAQLLGRRSVVLPGAVAATERLLGRPARSYRDYVDEVASRSAERKPVA